MRFVEALPGIEVFDATSELLKLVIRRTSRAGRRLFCFHSWRAVLTGIDAPLDSEEMDYFRRTNAADIHLVSSHGQELSIGQALHRPAITLPFTVFQNPNVYRNLHLPSDFDVAFSCMYTPEHFARKRAELLLALAAKYPSLRIVWFGDYCPYERWQMESAFNSHFNQYGPSPDDWGPLWTERESFLCWYNGGGVFRDECQKHDFLKSLVGRARDANLNIQFYKNLRREQVVEILNRTRTAVALGRLDQWPRCITEALACGTPVVCVDDLLSGTALIRKSNGVLVPPAVDDLFRGIECARRLDREVVRSDYYADYGIVNAATRLVKTLDESVGGNWRDVVSIQRPAETRFKAAIRAI